MSDLNSKYIYKKFKSFDDLTNYLNNQKINKNNIISINLDSNNNIIYLSLQENVMNKNKYLSFGDIQSFLKGEFVIHINSESLMKDFFIQLMDYNIELDKYSMNRESDYNSSFSYFVAETDSCINAYPDVKSINNCLCKNITSVIEYNDLF